MHEYSLVQALVDRVEVEARARSARSVERLTVRIGEAAGVDVELFTTAYFVFRERTLCERADLDVRLVPVQWACGECGVPIETGQPLRCPYCESPAILIAGDELILDRIEMEVP